MGLRTLGIAASGVNAKLVSQALSSSSTLSPLAQASAPSQAASLPSDQALRSVAAHQVSQGSLIVTANPLDLAIGGPGFFVLGDSKSLKLTRDGRFALDEEGFLTTLEGERLSPEIRLPSKSEGVQINRHGDVIARLSSGREFVGTIELATVSNPHGLRINGGSALEISPEAGQIVRGFPGESGFGLLVQGGIEAASTDQSAETLSSIVSARAFSANSRVLKLASKTSEELGDIIARHSRRRRGANTDVDLGRTQAADLVTRMQSGTAKLAGRPLSAELRAQLRARRLSAGEISKEALLSRSGLSERFARVAPEEEPSSSFLAQEIRLARRRGFELFQRRSGLVEN